MQTAMSKPSIINILLANQREVNKNELKELNICVSVQVQIYYNIYYYTSGLQFMSLVQQSQSGASRLLQQTGNFPSFWLDRLMVNQFSQYATRTFPLSSNKVRNLTFVHLMQTSRSWKLDWKAKTGKRKGQRWRFNDETLKKLLIQWETNYF